MTIRPAVVAKIAGMAAREVDGVSLGAMPGLVSLVLGATSAPGVKRSVKATMNGEGACVDIWLKVAYGPAISDVASQVRQAIRERLREMAKVEDVRINVHVTDMVLPGEDQQTAEK